jgi:hypothetical protein
MGALRSAVVAGSHLSRPSTSPDANTTVRWCGDVVAMGLQAVLLSQRAWQVGQSAKYARVILLVQIRGTNPVSPILLGEKDIGIRNGRLVEAHVTKIVLLEGPALLLVEASSRFRTMLTEAIASQKSNR